MDLSPENLLSWIDAFTGNPLLILLALATLSLIVDSAALVVAAILVGNGTLGALETILVLASAILAGDLAIYLFGRVARGHPWLEARLDRDQLDQMADWLTERQIAVLILSRFLPGTRSITYLACGFFRLPSVRFAIVTGITGLIWTIATIGFVGTLGHFFQENGPLVSITAGVIGALGLMLPARILARRSANALPRAPMRSKR